MKKLILILTLILTFCLVFVGCAEKESFDTSACIESIKAKGLTVSESATEGSALELANAKVNMEISMFNGNFTVEVKSYTVLVKSDSMEKSCKVIEMATEEEASIYGGFFINKRGEYDGYKVAIEDKTVIITNITDVEQAVDLIFK